MKLMKLWLFGAAFFALTASAWATPTVITACATTPALTDLGYPVVLCDANGRFIQAPVITSPSTSVQASSGNVANATAAAALPAVTAKTNFLTGIQITAGGATAGQCVSATIAGLLGGTTTYTYCSVTGAGLPSNPLAINFIPPIPASAVNTAITLSVPALGTGNTNAAVAIQGFVQ